VSLLFLNSWRVSSHIVRYDTVPLAIQKHCNGTREKLRLNLHSLSVSVLLEYGRKRITVLINLSLEKLRSLDADAYNRCS
jgi:hypothetical protein